MIKKSKEPVLVVDDEETICKMVAQVLAKEGYRPIICTHPRKALELIEREGFGLTFLDITMPEITGFELASIIKDQDPQCEIVFITGYDEFNIAVQAIKIGAYDFLKKPFNFNEIRLCLKRYQERARLRQKIRLTEQRHIDLVQHLPLIIFEIWNDFRLEFMNNTCKEILGFTPKEAVGNRNWFLDRVHSDDRMRIKLLFESAFQSGGAPFSAACRFNHKKGHQIHGIIKTIPYSGFESGFCVSRLDGIIVDITDRIFLERTLIQKEKLKTLGTISAEVAHEIRNPLVSIGGFARRLKKRSPLLPESDIILRESLRLEKILNRIRNYLKPVELFQKECSVNQIIIECLGLLSPEIKKRRIECRPNLEDGLPYVYTDPDVLAEVFINLIRNGIEAIDENGTLGINSFKSDQNVNINFTNQTNDFVLKDPESLFLPFDEGGQTIGLPYCYQILKKMGGVLSFSQERENMVFTVTLPKSGN